MAIKINITEDVVSMEEFLPKERKVKNERISRLQDIYGLVGTDKAITKEVFEREMGIKLSTSKQYAKSMDLKIVEGRSATDVELVAFEDLTDGSSV